MAALNTRVVAAMRAAQADSRAPYHLALSEADFSIVGLPPITIKQAARSSKSHLWALDTRGGHRLVPYPLEDA